jgi:uncharacterized protein
VSGATGTNLNVMRNFQLKTLLIKAIAASFVLSSAMSCIAYADTNNINARQVDDSTALLLATHQGDSREVARLIKAGADVSLANRYGATPMSEAAMIGDAILLKLLLDAGADVESPSGEGETALMLVARTGKVDAAKLLINRGANVNAKEQFGGQTALIWATAQGQVEMMKLLIKHGAQVNAQSAVREWPRKVTAEGRPKDMNRGGLTPLLYAAREGCIECAQVLLASGADINLPDPDKVTALTLAAMNLRWDMMKLLISKGANVNDWDFWGETPLYVAVDLNTLPIGGRIELPSADQTTSIEIIELLLKADANPNIQLKLRPPYRNAVLDRNSDEALYTGATPLMRAAKAGDIAACQLLLKHGARVDLPNIDDVTPLMVASGAARSTGATRGKNVTQAEIVATAELLIQAGANVNAVSKKGETALHGAALRGWNDLVKLLASKGAKLDALTKQNLSPIDYAMGRYQQGFLETRPDPLPQTAALLKELGAKLDHTDAPRIPGLPRPTITAVVPE